MLLIVLCLLAVAFVAFGIWERQDMARACVEAELRAAGASNIQISSDWVDDDSGVASFHVVYWDKAGRRVRNRCVVAVRPIPNKKVDWERPIQSPPSNAIREFPRKRV